MTQNRPKPLVSIADELMDDITLKGKNYQCQLCSIIIGQDQESVENHLKSKQHFNMQTTIEEQQASQVENLTKISLSLDQSNKRQKKAYRKIQDAISILIKKQQIPSKNTVQPQDGKYLITSKEEVKEEVKTDDFQKQKDSLNKGDKAWEYYCNKHFSSEKTRTLYITQVKRYSKWLLTQNQDRNLPNANQVNEGSLAAYINSCSSRAIKSISVAALKSRYNDFGGQNYKFPQVREKQKDGKVESKHIIFTLKEIDQLFKLSQKNTIVHALVRFLYDAAAPIITATGLKVNQFIKFKTITEKARNLMNNNVIELPNKEGSREVQLSSETVQAILKVIGDRETGFVFQRKNGQQKDSRNLAEKISDFFKKHNKKVVSKDFRITRAVHLYKYEGFNLMDVQQYLGHSSVLQTQFYIKEQCQNKKQLTEKVILEDNQQKQQQQNASVKIEPDEMIKVQNENPNEKGNSKGQGKYSKSSKRQKL
eukprot:403330756